MNNITRLYHSSDNVISLIRVEWLMVAEFGTFVQTNINLLYYPGFEPAAPQISTLLETTKLFNFV